MKQHYAYQIQWRIKLDVPAATYNWRVWDSYASAAVRDVQYNKFIENHKEDVKFDTRKYDDANNRDDAFTRGNQSTKLKSKKGHQLPML